MKTLTLKENQASYNALASEPLPINEPIIVEKDGRPVAALVPIEEFEAFKAWWTSQRLSLPANWFERTPEEVVADIKRRGPGVPNVRKATASLADLLENAPHDPDFDLEEWKREWAKVEAEIEANDPPSRC